MDLDKLYKLLDDAYDGGTDAMAIIQHLQGAPRLAGRENSVGEIQSCIEDAIYKLEDAKTESEKD